MYELVQAGPSSYYIDCPAKMGVYVRENGEAFLIDSGNDKDAGKKALKLLTGQGWTLKGILNTHSNADHIGGNRYLQQQAQCPVFAGGIEGAFTQYPILEPAFLYGGYPCKDLRHKFLLAAGSDVTPFTDPAFPAEVEIIPLPGHFFDMVGFRTPDGTVFLADCLASRETLEKYRVAFLYDAAQYLETLDRVEAMEAPMFVPAHAEAGADLRALVDYNRKTVHEVADQIVEFCRVPSGFESILQRVFETYHLSMNFEQYVLVGSTVRSYLSWLKDAGRLDAAFERNLLLWSPRA